MVKLTVLEFEKKEPVSYDVMYQDVKSLILEKYSDFSFIEIVGILECMAMEFKHMAIMKTDE